MTGSGRDPRPGRRPRPPTGRHTRDAYDRLAPVWSDTTDDGPFNGGLERPALRSLVPRPLAGRVVVDAACGSGAQCEWLADQGAEVIGFDLSPKMIDEAARRCGGRATLHVADLAGPLPIASDSVDGITCSLALHYLDDWGAALGVVRPDPQARGGGACSRRTIPSRPPPAGPAGDVLRPGTGHRPLGEGRRRRGPALLAPTALPDGGRLRRCRVRGRAHRRAPALGRARWTASPTSWRPWSVRRGSRCTACSSADPGAPAAAGDRGARLSRDPGG